MIGKEQKYISEGFENNYIDLVGVFDVLVINLAQHLLPKHMSI